MAGLRGSSASWSRCNAEERRPEVIPDWHFKGIELEGCLVEDNSPPGSAAYIFMDSLRTIS